MIKKARYFMCDFETTVYEGQESTEVWASAVVELFTEDVKIFHSIDETLKFFKSLKCNIIAYYHNLKFDGQFWLWWLSQHGFKQALHMKDGKVENVEFVNDKDMLNNTYKYSISDRGQFYTITIKSGGKKIQLRDSLKLLPFSVKRIGESFATKHKKLEMEYKGYRYSGCEIAPKEREYIANDVLVVKEALEIMFNEGHNRLTIGSCCLSEYKLICRASLKNQLTFDEMFPDIYEKEINVNIHKYKNAGEWVRKSYKGGWCYLVKGKENKLFYNGTTADVNSLYPSMMHSESGNKYPIGYPIFWSGNYIPAEALYPNRYYFVRVKTRFYLKPNYLPFIQIKGNYLYKGTESLATSDVYDKKNDCYYKYYRDLDGNLVDTRVELTMTMTDFDLIKEHYNLVDFEILDGCFFYSMTGIFDEYIDKYRKIKQDNKGAKRELAKLFLNNLYGKMAASTDSSFKYCYVNDENVLNFVPVVQNDKKPGYIPVGSAITSYARNFTIRAAQKNYHGKDVPGFIYADTDSVHCDLLPEQIKGISVDDKAFCCWKLESCWDRAIFTRQKTYIEHVVAENLQKIETPYHNIKCAGMPKKCKDLLEKSFDGSVGSAEEYTEDEKHFLFNEEGGKIIRDYSDFKIGLKIPGKLLPKRLPGGVVLVDTTYEIR